METLKSFEDRRGPTGKSTFLLETVEGSSLMIFEGTYLVEGFRGLLHPILPFVENEEVDLYDEFDERREELVIGLRSIKGWGDVKVPLVHGPPSTKLRKWVVGARRKLAEE